MLIDYIIGKACDQQAISMKIKKNSRLLVVDFLESQKLHTDFQLHGGWRPNHLIVQGSTV